jgi:hypothetical protein
MCHEARVDFQVVQAVGGGVEERRRRGGLVQVLVPNGDEVSGLDWWDQGHQPCAGVPRVEGEPRQERVRQTGRHAALQGRVVVEPIRESGPVR